MEKRPKLGAYQRWVRELDVAEGDVEELLMLDQVMRLAGGLAVGPAVGPAAAGRLEATAPWAPVLQVEPEAPEAKQAEAEVEGSGSVANQLLKLISARKAAPQAPGCWV